MSEENQRMMKAIQYAFIPVSNSILHWSRYAYGDVVNEHGAASSPAWQPVFVKDHSHWARLLIPDGEIVFGQLADPPPSCQNVSAFGDLVHGPVADLSQHRGISIRKSRHVLRPFNCLALPRHATDGNTMNQQES